MNTKPSSIPLPPKGYPKQAFWIDVTLGNRVAIKPVTVEAVYRRLDTHFAMFTTDRDKFQVKHSRPLAELATTPERVLEKLPALLTALATRPPLARSGKDAENAVRGMTEAGAENPGPKTQTEAKTA